MSTWTRKTLSFTQTGRRSIGASAATSLSTTPSITSLVSTSGATFQPTKPRTTFPSSSAQSTEHAHHVSKEHLPRYLAEFDFPVLDLQAVRQRAARADDQPNCWSSTHISAASRQRVVESRGVAPRCTNHPTVRRGGTTPRGQCLWRGRVSPRHRSYLLVVRPIASFRQLWRYNDEDQHQGQHQFSSFH